MCAAEAGGRHPSAGSTRSRWNWEDAAAVARSTTRRSRHLRVPIGWESAVWLCLTQRQIPQSTEACWVKAPRGQPAATAPQPCAAPLLIPLDPSSGSSSGWLPWPCSVPEHVEQIARKLLLTGGQDAAPRKVCGSATMLSRGVCTWLWGCSGLECEPAANICLDAAAGEGQGHALEPRGQKCGLPADCPPDLRCCPPPPSSPCLQCE